MFWTKKGSGAAPHRLPPEETPLSMAAMDALDTLEVVSPGWKTVTVRFEMADGEHRIAELETTALSPSAHQLTVRNFRLDPGEWLASGSAAFERLRNGLLENGLRWNGLVAQCEREELKGGRVTLLDENERPAIEIPICQSLANGQLLNAELFRRFAESRAEWEQQQVAIDKALAGLQSWRYDRDQTELVFNFQDGRSSAIRTQVLGSYSPIIRTWCWSWANRSHAPSDHQLVSMCAHTAAGRPGLGALWRGGFFCDNHFGYMISLLATSEMGGFGIFSWDRPDLRVYYAFMDSPERLVAGEAQRGGLFVRFLKYGRSFTGSFTLDIDRDSCSALVEKLHQALSTREPVRVFNESFQIQFEPSDAAEFFEADDGLVIRVNAAAMTEISHLAQAPGDGSASELASIPGLALRV